MKIVKNLINILRRFNNDYDFDYKVYWEERYRKGGTSGDGSYGVLAEYKSEFLNKFVEDHNIQYVIEFGVGDGNQLQLARYHKYLGLDISQKAISICLKKFLNDKNKSFMLYDPSYFKNNDFLLADLVICLDVLYHITDEIDFNKTLNDIYSCSSKFIILYTPIHKNPTKAKHIFFRELVPILEERKQFFINEIVEQPYADLTSAQFIVLEKK